MSKSKLKKFAELATYKHVIQPTFKEVWKSNLYLKHNWNKSFFQNRNKIILEIGCGKGEYTIALAEKYPHINFIGIDIKGARLWKGATIAMEKNLANVGFLRTHVELLKNIFAKDEISEIWLPFPDPQMKKLRKRLVSTRFLDIYQQILCNHGLIHLKTDSQFLYFYIKALFKKNNIKPIYQSQDILKNPVYDDMLLAETHYEKQFKSIGINIKYIQFKLPSHKLIEPEVKIQHDSWKSYGRKNQSKKM